MDYNDPMHLIVSSGNTAPFHQDMVTGRNVFDQSYKKDQDGQFTFLDKQYLRPLHRVLIDLGSLLGEHNSRPFMFKERKSEDILLNTEARVIAMNAGAAGSGGKSEIYHGRFGDGVTVQLDLILNKSKKKGGKAKNIGVGGVINDLIRKKIKNM